MDFEQVNITWETAFRKINDNQYNLDKFLNQLLRFQEDISGRVSFLKKLLSEGL